MVEKQKGEGDRVLHDLITPTHEALPLKGSPASQRFPSEGVEFNPEYSKSEGRVGSYEENSSEYLS